MRQEANSTLQEKPSNPSDQSGLEDRPRNANLHRAVPAGHMALSQILCEHPAGHRVSAFLTCNYRNVPMVARPRRSSTVLNTVCWRMDPIVTPRINFQIRRLMGLCGRDAIHRRGRSFSHKRILVNFLPTLYKVVQWLMRLHSGLYGQGEQLCPCLPWHIRRESSWLDSCPDPPGPWQRRWMFWSCSVVVRLCREAVGLNRVQHPTSQSATDQSLILLRIWAHSVGLSLGKVSHEANVFLYFGQFKK